jgi:hypothetical protein
VRVSIQRHLILIRGNTSAKSADRINRGAEQDFLVPPTDAYFQKTTSRGTKAGEGNKA